MGRVTMKKEMHYLCQGNYMDPARYDLALIHPLHLNKSWKMGISEITIPSCLKYFSKDDFIEFQNVNTESLVLKNKRNIRKKRGVLENVLYIIRIYDSVGISLGNYFPWLKKNSEERNMTELYAYVDFLANSDEPLAFRTAPLRFLSSLWYQRYSNTVELWNKTLYPNKDALIRDGFKQRDNANEYIGPFISKVLKYSEENNIAFELEFSSLKGFGDPTPSSYVVFRKIYEAIFSNDLSRYARANQKTTMKFLKWIDFLITIFHDFIKEQEELRENEVNTENEGHLEQDNEQNGQNGNDQDEGSPEQDTEQQNQNEGGSNQENVQEQNENDEVHQEQDNEQNNQEQENRENENEQDEVHQEQDNVEENENTGGDDQDIKEKSETEINIDEICQSIISSADSFVSPINITVPDYENEDTNFILKLRDKLAFPDNYFHQIPFIEQTPGECFQFLRNNSDLCKLVNILNAKYNSNFHLDSITRKLKIYVAKEEKFILHGRLPDVLSLPRKLLPGKNYSSEHCVDITIDNKLAYIYCNLSQRIFVSDTSLPLIQIIPLKQSCGPEDIHIEFPFPLMFDLNCDYLSDISFVLYNEIGNRLIFEKHLPAQIKLVLIQK